MRRASVWLTDGPFAENAETLCDIFFIDAQIWMKRSLLPR